MRELVEVMKKAAIDAIEQTKPADIITGTVKSNNPLVININQRLDITEDFILLTDNTRDYSVEIDIDYQTNDTLLGGESHSHTISGTTSISIKNGLSVGEKVIMAKAKGGQQFVVLNRVVNA